MSDGPNICCVSNTRNRNRRPHLQPKSCCKKPASAPGVCCLDQRHCSGVLTTPSCWSFPWSSQPRPHPSASSPPPRDRTASVQVRSRIDTWTILLSAGKRHLGSRSPSTRMSNLRLSQPSDSAFGLATRAHPTTTLQPFRFHLGDGDGALGIMEKTFASSPSLAAKRHTATASRTACWLDKWPDSVIPCFKDAGDLPYKNK